MWAVVYYLDPLHRKLCSLHRRAAHFALFQADEAETVKNAHTGGTEASLLPIFLNYLWHSPLSSASERGELWYKQWEQSTTLATFDLYILDAGTQFGPMV